MFAISGTSKSRGARGGLKNSGLNKEIKNFVLSAPGVQNFLLTQKNLLADYVQALEKNEFDELKIFYGCAGGYQRSVVIAQELYYWLDHEFSDDYQINLAHLTMQKCIDHFKINEHQE